MTEKINCEYYKNDSIEVKEFKEEDEILVHLSLILDDKQQGLFITQEKAILLANELMKIANINKNV